MSIKAMQQAIEAIQDLRGYRPDIDKAIEALRTAIQQAEAPHTATAIACGIPGMAKTTCPYCEQGFAFEFKQAEAKMDEMDPLFVKGALSGIVDAQVRDLWPTKSATHPAPGVQGVPEGFALVPLKAEPKVAMVLYEGARNCFSPKVAEDLWQDALTAAQAQKGD